MADLTIYSFLNVACNIGGVLVDRLWEGDDAVILEPHVDISTPLIGVDGIPLISVSADRAITITVKLQPTSSMHTSLLRRHADMHRGIFQSFPVSLTDVSNGTGGSCSECMILAKPSEQYGANASVREWKLFAGIWISK
jgi:hypothetical protein